MEGKKVCYEMTANVKLKIRCLGTEDNVQSIMRLAGVNRGDMPQLFVDNLKMELGGVLERELNIDNGDKCEIEFLEADCKEIELEDEVNE